MSLGHADIPSASLHLFMSWFYSFLSLCWAHFLEVSIHTYVTYTVCHPSEESYSFLIASEKSPGKIQVEGSWVICSSLNLLVQVEGGIWCDWPSLMPVLLPVVGMEGRS